MVGWDATAPFDEVGLCLLLPASQLAALEAAAARTERTVEALLRSIIGDFLRPPST